MKPFPISAGVCALGLLVTSAGPIDAAWNNVFQITCHRRGCRTATAFVQVPTVAAAAPDPCCNPCPQPVCTTRYVQRCYYQPITTYQTRTYFEPVTTYRTSYYYEPVTSYRYSCYFDPCTCSYQKVACPVQSFQLRAQCCPVQSWVQRCCTVPVQSYQRCTYWEPQTCCTTPQPCCGNGGVNGAAVPPVVATPGAQVQIQEQQQQLAPQAPPGQPFPQTQPPPQIEERRGGNGSGPYGPTYPGPGTPGAPGAPGASYRHQLPNGPAPARPVSPTPAQGVRPDRIASAPAARLEVQVVRSDRTPRAGARVMFVSAQQRAPSQVVTANATGRFQVSLASGGWLVYVSGPDGRQTFHSRIDVSGRQPAPLMVVTR
jgi:hypothetical protein